MKYFLSKAYEGGNRVITNGSGGKFLADDGTYKTGSGGGGGGSGGTGGGISGGGGASGALGGAGGAGGVVIVFW